MARQSLLGVMVTLAGCGQALAQSSAAPADAVPADGAPEAPAAAEPAPSVDWQGPFGGWRHSGLSGSTQPYAVAYPTPPIDRGAQGGRSLIEGRLRGIDATRRAQRLVANGNPLPLYSDGEGRFVRPFAFGAGSNSVSLVSADGQTLHAMQFYEADTSRVPVRIRVVLGWDDPAAELDLHIITPDGQHAFWASPRMTNGGGLDVDSVDGPGPEMFTMTAPLPGQYLVYVNYWGNYGGAGYNFDDDSNDLDLVTAQVNLVFQENSIDERRETFLVPLRNIGELTLIKAFQY